MFLHITECARWRTEHHQGCCTPLLLVPKMVSATFTGGVSPVPPSIYIRKHIARCIVMRTPTFPSFTFTFGNSTYTHIFTLLPCGLVPCRSSSVTLKPSALVETCQRCLIITSSQKNRRNILYMCVCVCVCVCAPDTCSRNSVSRNTIIKLNYTITYVYTVNISRKLYTAASTLHDLLFNIYKLYYTYTRHACHIYNIKATHPLW